MKFYGIKLKGWIFKKLLETSEKLKQWINDDNLDVVVDLIAKNSVKNKTIDYQLLFLINSYFVILNGWNYSSYYLNWKFKMKKKSSGWWFQLNMHMD